MRKNLDLPLTSDELYWFGLMQADGSIDRAAVRVRLTQKDRFVLEEFLRFLGQDTKITRKSSRTTYGLSESYTASTGAQHRQAILRLIELGLKGHIHESFYKSRHFWRGLIDGDGGIYIHKRGDPVISLCSDREVDVVAFSHWVGSLFDYPGPKPYLNKAGNCWYVSVGGAKARLLGPYLYEDGYSAVHRKRDLALSFYEIATKSRIAITWC